MLILRKSVEYRLIDNTETFCFNISYQLYFHETFLIDPFVHNVRSSGHISIDFWSCMKGLINRKIEFLVFTSFKKNGKFVPIRIYTILLESSSKLA